MQKIVFPSFPSRNNFSNSWIHQKKDSKKKKQSLQEESKKRVKQNEKPFFKRQKNETWKKHLSEKGPTKKGNRENVVFYGKGKTEKESFAEVQKDTFFAQSLT